jgi:type VI protein secretion system component VasK
MQEVDTALQPETGALWASYNASLKQYLVPLGSQYGPNPAATQPVNPRFVQSFSRAAQISSGLYPPGQKSASFTFSLRFLPSSAVSSASLVVDGARTPANGATQQFTWNGAPTQHAALALDNKEIFAYEGPWSVFQLIRVGTKVSRLPSGSGYRVDYPINIAVAGHNVAVGGGKVASFELTGPGADLLVQDGLSGLSCAVPVIK